MAWILLRPSNYKQVAPLVRTGGSRHTGLAAPPHRNIHPAGHDSIVCCETEHIDHIQPHDNFPAQSFHFRFGSAAPCCPTLKPGVTASVPRTRYRRLARPYLIGFSYSIVISLPGLAEFPPLARGNQLG